MKLYLGLGRRRGTSVTEIAATWALEEEAQGLSPERSRALAQWLALDERHVDASAAAWLALRRLEDHAEAPELMALRSQALVRRGAGRASTGGWRRPVAAGLAGVLALGASWIAVPRYFQAGGATARYETQKGERLAVTLADGSTMTLDTDSAAETRFSRDERTIRLLRGQALFAVAHGQPAPFRVEARDRVVTAKGTLFDVRMTRAGHLLVALIEGSVTVAPRDTHPLSGTTLAPGEVMTSERPGELEVRAADVHRLVLWQRGLIAFDNVPLPAAIADMNRYATKRLELGSAELGGLRVSGVFRVADSRHFAQLISEINPIVIEEQSDRVILKTTKNSK